MAIAVVNLPVERDRRVIRECLALEAAGYRVTVICPRGEQGLRQLPGTRDTAIRSFRQPLAGSGVLSFAAEFAWSFVCVAWHLLVLVLTQRVVAAQACNPPDVFWPLALLMRALGRPFVFDHHDLSPELYLCKTQQPKQTVLKVLTLFEKLSMRCASWVISTNESYREIAINRGGCRPERVSVVRNGPSLAEVAARPAAGSATSAVRRIVYLGVINPQDAVEAVVLSAERLIELRGRPGWEIVIAGDGDCLAELRELAARRDLHDVVRFTGWLSGTEVDEVLASAVIGIQPDPRTLMAELSTMAKTVEYVARGLPVVAVDLLETHRTAADAAAYVPHGTPDELAEAIDRLLDDDARLAAMGEIGRERFRTTLAWEHQAAEYIRLWQALVPLPTSAGAAAAATWPTLDNDQTVPEQRRPAPVQLHPAKTTPPNS